jgi:gliding motility-associated-like protein
MSCLRLILALLFCIVLGIMPLRAQLFINEVSNGPSGAQEYVELLVVGTPSCTASCVDLRGWVLDDNNGYFASGTGTGIAQGHMRFTTSATWQCVPIGTIILIYNESDRNAAIPADNLTGANCTYILPASSTLFERNTTAPVVNGSQTYGAPYVAGGAWSTQGLSNNDDSYQLRDPNNLTVPYHAVGYGNNTTNSIIYFAGGGAQGVFYMANTTTDDPFTQANWIKGVVPTEETPGAPNNTANATWIATLNNNCTPFTGAQVDLGPDVSVCPGGSVTITATANISGTFTWNVPGSGSSVTISPTAATTTVIVNFDGGSGCTDADTILINLFTPPVGAIAGTLDVCLGQSTTLTASGGASYLWSTTDVTPDITVSPAATTLYTVTVTNANGCADTVSATVNVNSLPVGAIAGNTTVCSGTSTTLTASGGTIFVWSTTEATAAITVAPATNTTYTVTITDGNGCSDTVSSTVNVNIAAGGSITGSTTICQGDSTNLTASGGASYVWSTTDVTQIITVSPTTNTTYSVTVTDGNGCLDTVTAQVTVTPAPIANAGADVVVCEGSSVFITASGGGTYAWSTSETTDAISVSPTTTTDYVVTVTVNGCTDADTVTITVNPNTIILAVDNITPETCNQGNGEIYLLSPSNFVTYTLFQNGQAIDTALGGGTFFDLTAGTYDIIATDNNGCQRNISSVVVPSVTAPPFTVDIVSPLCFADNTGSIVFNGANTLTFGLNGGAQQASGSFTGLTSGSYVINVLDNGSGCDTTVNITLTQPDALVTSIVPDSVNILTGDAIDLVSTTIGGSLPYAYFWAPSTGLDCDTCATVNASPIDSINVYILTATDLNGCIDTARVVVRVSNEFLITVPTGFTPNGDGWNDFLRPLSNEPIDFNLAVYNRWGEKIFEGDNMPGWDGTYKYEEQPISTYVYVIEYTRLLTGKKGYLTGSITLLR